MSSPALVQKFWNYCNILRDNGLSYGDYVEHLPFPLFLKVADEQARPPFDRPSQIVAEALRRLSMVDELESVVSANLQRAIRLLQSIHQRAFTGELT